MVIHSITNVDRERRKELVKAVYASGEMAKVSVRAACKDGKKELSRLLKDKEISEDDERCAEGLLQRPQIKLLQISIACSKPKKRIY